MSKKMSKIRQSVKKAVCTILAAAMLAGTAVAVAPVEAQAASTVSVARFNSMLKDVTGKDAWTKKDAFYKSKAALTNEVAAQMALRADEQMNGEGYDGNLYTQVVKKKRIKDLSKAAKKYREALTLCFVKGIMPGKSPKAYSHQRTLSPKAKTTPSDASSIVSRVKTKSKRIKLTPDGQVTRTKNLPKNASSYSYILASFPNSYYEPKFQYQLVKYEAGYTPKNLVDYAAPKNVLKVTDGWGYNEKYSFKQAYNSYSDQWMELVKKNLELRFNYNYRTTDFNKWKAELLKTFPDTYKDTYSKYIDNWRKFPTECQVVSKTAEVVVDPSSIYLGSSGDYYVRCYVKFKIDANRYLAPETFDQNAYVFASHANFPGLQLGKYYELVTDICIGGWAVNSHGDDATITDLYIGPAGLAKIAP